MALGYYAASALSLLHWHFRVLLQGSRAESSPILSQVPLGDLSYLLYAERILEQRLSQLPGLRPASPTFWSRCISLFHLFLLTTFLRQVPLVSIVTRVSPVCGLRLSGASRLSGGFRPLSVPQVKACLLNPLAAVLAKTSLDVNLNDP